MANTNGKSNVSTVSNTLKFEIMNDGEVVGNITVDPGVRLSSPSKDTGRGGGKEYIAAEMQIDFGESGSFGGRVTLWPPREAIDTSRNIVRHL